jgi:hypothetical protein
MAFNSANNIESQILEEDGFGPVGFIILAVLYFFMGIGSLISTAVINKCGTKICLCIGGIGCIIQILTTILPGLKSHDENFFMSHNDIVACLFVAATINGLCDGILWTSAN